MKCVLRAWGHSPKKTNNRVATAKKLSVACPKPPSKVRALGARDLCAPQNKPHIDNNNARHRPPTSKYVMCRAPLETNETSTTRKEVDKENK